MDSILKTLNDPQQLKTLSIEELNTLSQEIRIRIIDILSITGGHLSSNLGIVELTIALHFVFNSPKDKFIFDVGHQSYIHKLLTGRNSYFSTLRQTEGMSGFTDPSESMHDLFYSGHAGNAFSLALGMAKNRDLRKKNEVILPILGDAALTCGLTLEAMNNIPNKLKKFIVILNDNAMSISKNVGAITGILSRFFNSPIAHNIYEELKQIISNIPGCWEPFAIKGSKIKESLQNLVSTAPFFEQFGLSYIGPIDGHDIKKMIDTFNAIKDVDRPTLVHILTVKGQGMKKAIKHPTPYHGAKPFNRLTGTFHPSKSVFSTFPKIFGKHLLTMADNDPYIVGITPAMPVGSCMDGFMKKYPNRCIDVGIAEGHSITYAGGIGHGGKLKVITCVYSSFLQRALDNIYHDVCVQNSPIVIAIDRAGLATGDGITAQGLYDISFLNSMPNMVIVQPRDGHLLKELLESAFNWNQPTAIRYPNLTTTELEKNIEKRTFGKGEILAEGKDVALISLGHMHKIAFDTRKLLLKEGINSYVIDPIFIKPLDKALLLEILQKVQVIVTIEEHSLQGGLGSIINSFIINEDLKHLKIVNIGIPDEFIYHGKYTHLLEKYGITPQEIFNKVLQLIPKHVTI